MFDFHRVPNRQADTQGRVVGGGAVQGVRYPSPFFDVAHTYLPATIKQMFRWCRYYYLTNPLISATVNKMAEYPITDIIVDEDNPGLKDKWERFFEDTIKLRPFLIEAGLFFMCYGNAMVSLSHPFIKWLICPHCRKKVQATKARFQFRETRFFLYCPHCGETGDATAFDQYLRSPDKIRLILWNPEDIELTYNDLTGETRYFYTVPPKLKNQITLGKRDVVTNIPQIFIDSVKQEKAVVISADNIFHFKRPSILTGYRDRGWGVPMILSVLKDVFYLQLMKKAQECVSPATLIETRQGLIPADDICVGDTVRTHTGSWHPIEKKWYRDAREGEAGRKITTTGLRTFDSVYSPGHPMFTIRRNEKSRRKDTKERQRSSAILRNPHLWEEVLCPAEQIQIGDYLLYPRKLPSAPQTIDVAEITGLYSVDGHVYSGGCAEETVDRFAALERGEHIPYDNAGRVAKRCAKDGRTPKRLPTQRELTDDLAYILGWYAGDGSTGTGHIEISMGPDDDPNPLAAAVKREFGLDSSVYPYKKSRGKSFTFCGVIVTRLIKGLIPGTARVKAVPQIILDGPDSAKLAFLKGYWEADGYDDDDRATLATSSRELAYGTYRLLIHSGCIATIGPHHNPSSVVKTTGQVIPASDAFHVNVSSASKHRLFALWAEGEAAEVVSGKSGFFWKDYLASRVCAVEEVEEEIYIDFKILEDTTFCTPGAATKNSILLERIVPLTVLFPQPGSGASDPFCVTHDTLIETRSGLKPAGEVQTGDFVKSHTGEWQCVEGVIDREVPDKESVYEFVASSLTAFPFRVSEEHPVLAARRPRDRKWCGYDSLGEPTWTEAEDLRAGDYVCYPTTRTTWECLSLDLADFNPERGVTNEWLYRRLNTQAAEIYEYFEQNGGVPRFSTEGLRKNEAPRSRFLEEMEWTERDYDNARGAFYVGKVDRIPRYIPVTKELAFIIGLYAAEGCPNGTIAVLTLNEGEGRLADRVDECLVSLGFSKSSRSNVRGGAFTCSINDVLLSGLLIESCGRGAVNQRLPRFILEAPEEIALSAVEATLLGDGCNFETESTRRVGLKTISPQLAMDVRGILLSIGLLPVTHKADPRPDEIAKSTYYQVDLNGTQADHLAYRFGWQSEDAVPWSRCGFHRGGYAYMRVSSKEGVEADVVRGFQVGEDKSFCVAGVATHNTTINLQAWKDQVSKEIQRWRCITPDSLVETENGLRPAGLVKEGDYLKNRLGGFAQVIDRCERPLDPGEGSYRLKVRGQHAVQTVYSEEHPIWAAPKIDNGNGHKLGTPQFIRVDELHPGDYVGYPITREVKDAKEIDIADHVDRAATKNWVYVDHTCPDVPEAFEYLLGGASMSRQDALEKFGWGLNSYKIAQIAVREGRTLRRVPRRLPMDHELAYVLGMYTAEGNATPKGVFFSLHKDEADIADRLDRFFHKRFGALRTGGAKSENGVQYAYSNIIAAQLFHSLVPGVAINKRLPEVARNATDSFLLETIRGVLDGDGAYYEEKTTLEVASRQLAEDVRQALLSWEIMPGISLFEGGPRVICGKATRGSGSYKVQVSGDQHRHLTALLNGEEYTKSGFCMIGLFKDRFAWFRIEAVEEVEVETVIGFQMEGDSTFCTWGVATHNSDRNYIPILPLPIGHQVIGGDGRALLMSQEIKLWSDQIVAGMGVPNEFIFGGLQWCLHGLTRISTIAGIQNLEDVVKSGKLIDVLTEDGSRKVTHLHEVGEKPALKLRTARGFELTGAGTHPVMTLLPDLSLEYRDLSEIGEGDYVVTKRGSTLWPDQPPSLPLVKRQGREQYGVETPGRLNKDMARLFGYVTSEGSLKEDRLSFGNTDPDVMDDFLGCFRSVFGFEPAVQERKDNGKHKKVYVVDVSRKALCRFLLKCGVGGKSHEKQVPPSVLGSPASYVAAYLSSYFEGDGGVSFKKTGGHVHAVTVSADLARDVQLLLLNLGILSSRYPPTGASSCHKIAIRGKLDLIKFQELIGFRSVTKIKKLDALISSIASKHSDSLPYIWEALRMFRDKNRVGGSSWQWEPFEFEATARSYSTKEVAEVLGRGEDAVRHHIKSGRLRAEKRSTAYVILGSDLEKFCRCYGRGKQVPFPRLHKGATRFNMEGVDLSLVEDKDPELYRKIKTILDTSFVFDRVDSVDEVGIEMMYDLTVEGTHSYIAGGLVTHNSGSNVSMRMLENQFLGYIQDLSRFVRIFLIPKVSAWLGWSKVAARFKPFKMADDLQRKALYLQLNQGGKISDTTLLQDSDFNPKDEDELMNSESERRLEAVKKQQLAEAEIQGEMMLLQSKYQAKAQAAQQAEMMQAQAGQSEAAPGEPADIVGSVPVPGGAQVTPGQLGAAQPPSQGVSGGAPPPGVPPQQIVEQLAQRLSAMDPEAQRMAVETLAARSQELAQAVWQALQQLASGGPQMGGGSTMKPLPEQRPPRRGPEHAVI